MDIPIGRYQHYKGKFYQVIGVARHSETLEEMVVYQGEYNDPEFGNNPIWVRPKQDFLATVEVNGQQIPRFRFMV